MGLERGEKERIVRLQDYNRKNKLENSSHSSFHSLSSIHKGNSDEQRGKELKRLSIQSTTSGKNINDDSKKSILERHHNHNIINRTKQHDPNSKNIRAPSLEFLSRSIHSEGDGYTNDIEEQLSVMSSLRIN